MPGVLAEIRRAGVEHVVLLSSRSVVGGDRSSAIVSMWMVSEAAVQSSGVPWTILQPSGFMSNALRWCHINSVERSRACRIPLGGWAGFLRNSWIVAALALLIVSGIVWIGFLLRYQARLVRLSTAAVESGAQLCGEFFQVLYKWYVGGTLATILPVLSLLLMVLKPRLC